MRACHPGPRARGDPVHRRTAMSDATPTERQPKDMSNRCDSGPQDIATRLNRVREQICVAERRYGRPPGSVRLLAVSKGHTNGSIQEAIAWGQRHFGESYLQEAQLKIQQLDDERLVWHFVGPLQSNKTRDVSRLFQWVHSVDRLKLALRLNAHRPQQLPPLNVCLQVNLDQEPSKRGVAPQELGVLAAEIAQLPRLRLRGLMAVPRRRAELKAQRQGLAPLRRLFEGLRAQGHSLDILSMGMSTDMEAAIAEGSTLVRIGTAIFGPRPAH